MRQYGKIEPYLIEYQYFGSIELYSSLIRSKHITFSSELLFQNAHHANRTCLYGPNGLLSLSVPLLGGRKQKMLFKEVRLADDKNWQRIQWRTIHDAYRKSPWFEELGGRVERLYQEAPRFLVDWNLRCMQFCFEVLKLDSDILTESVLLNGAEYLKFQSQPNLVIPHGYPSYQQVFMDRRGFVPNLSILDLLFCEGPGSIDYLIKLNQYKNSISS